MPAVGVGVDDGEVAELAVDVADAGDGGAVVMHAAHQEQVAGTEIQILSGVECRIDERVQVAAAEAAQGLLVGAELRIADVQLAEHIGGIARNAQRIAQGPLAVEGQKPTRVPVGDLVA